MPSPEAVLHNFPNPSFKTPSNGSHDCVSISAWKPALNKKSEPWSGKAAGAANEEAPGEFDQRHIESRRSDNDELIAREVKSAVKNPVANKMANMVKVVLDKVLRKKLHNAK